MDYYGQGMDTDEGARTSYLLEDLSADLNLGLEFFGFRAGLTGGVVVVDTGSGNRGGFPSIEEVFTPLDTPGLGTDTDFIRGGGFLQFDYRDIPSGPKSGGNYMARMRRYSDKATREHSFRQLELVAEQYFPYFNRTRVIAVRVRAHMTFANRGRAVPFYLQPTIGGNDDLRGFARYRFYDNNSILASVEHRWHAFTGLDMAIFVDAGKVAPDKSNLDFSDLEYSAGFGFRGKLQNAVVMRVDFAFGSEGFRWIWTFSDIFRGLR